MPKKIRKLDVSCPNKKCTGYNKIGLKNIIRFGKQKNKHSVIVVLIVEELLQEQ